MTSDNLVPNALNQTAAGLLLGDKLLGANKLAKMVDRVRSNGKFLQHPVRRQTNGDSARRRNRA